MRVDLKKIQYAMMAILYGIMAAAFVQAYWLNGKITETEQVSFVGWIQVYFLFTVFHAGGFVLWWILNKLHTYDWCRTRTRPFEPHELMQRMQRTFELRWYQAYLMALGIMLYLVLFQQYAFEIYITDVYSSDASSAVYLAVIVACDLGLLLFHVKFFSEIPPLNAKEQRYAMQMRGDLKPADEENDPSSVESLDPFIKKTSNLESRKPTGTGGVNTQTIVEELSLAKSPPPPPTDDGYDHDDDDDEYDDDQSEGDTASTSSGDISEEEGEETDDGREKKITYYDDEEDGALFPFAEDDLDWMSMKRLRLSDVQSAEILRGEANNVEPFDARVCIDRSDPPVSADELLNEAEPSHYKNLIRLGIMETIMEVVARKKIEAVDGQQAGMELVKVRQAPENNWFADLDNEPVIHQLVQLIRQSRYVVTAENRVFANGEALLLRPFNKEREERERVLLELVPKAWEDSYLRAPNEGEASCTRGKQCVGHTKLNTIYDWPEDAPQTLNLVQFVTPREFTCGTAGSLDSRRRRIGEGHCLPCLWEQVTEMWLAAWVDKTPAYAVLQPYRVRVGEPGEYDAGSVIPTFNDDFYGICDNFPYFSLNRFEWHEGRLRQRPFNVGYFRNAPYVFDRSDGDLNVALNRLGFGFYAREPRRDDSCEPWDSDEEEEREYKASRDETRAGRNDNDEDARGIDGLTEEEVGARLGAINDVSVFDLDFVGECASVNVRDTLAMLEAHQRGDVSALELAMAKISFRSRNMPSAMRAVSSRVLAFDLAQLFDVSRELTTSGLFATDKDVNDYIKRRGTWQLTVSELLFRALPFEKLASKFADRIKSAVAREVSRGQILMNKPVSGHVIRFMCTVLRASMGGFYAYPGRPPTCLSMSLSQRFWLMEYLGARPGGNDPEAFFANLGGLLLVCLREFIIYSVKLSPTLEHAVRRAHGASWDNFTRQTVLQVERARSSWLVDGTPWCEIQRGLDLKRSLMKPLKGWCWTRAYEFFRDKFTEALDQFPKIQPQDLRLFDVRHAYDGTEALLRRAHLDGGYSAGACELLRMFFKYPGIHQNPGRVPNLAKIPKGGGSPNSMDQRSLAMAINATASPAQIHEAYLISMIVHEGFCVRSVRAPFHWVDYESNTPALNEVLACPHCHTIKGVDRKCNFLFDLDKNRSFCEGKKKPPPSGRDANVEEDIVQELIDDELDLAMELEGMTECESDDEEEDDSDSTSSSNDGSDEEDASDADTSDEETDEDTDSETATDTTPEDDSPRENGTRCSEDLNREFESLWPNLANNAESKEVPRIPKEPSVSDEEPEEPEEPEEQEEDEEDEYADDKIVASISRLIRFETAGLQNANLNKLETRIVDVMERASVADKRNPVDEDVVFDVNATRETRAEWEAREEAKQPRMLAPSRLTSMCHSTICPRTECVPLDLHGNIVMFFGRKLTQCARCRKPRLLYFNPYKRNTTNTKKKLKRFDAKKNTLVDQNETPNRVLCNNCTKKTANEIHCERCGTKFKEKSKKEWARVRVFFDPFGREEVAFCQSEKLNWVTQYHSWNYFYLMDVVYAATVNENLAIRQPERTETEIRVRRRRAPRANATAEGGEPVKRRRAPRKPKTVIQSSALGELLPDGV